MWKLGLTGAWCAGVCLASVYAAVQWAPAPKQAETQYPLMTEHETVKSEIVTVLIINGSKVDGYVVGEVTLTANEEAWHGSAGAAAELTDELIAVLQASPVLTDPEFSADTLRSHILYRMNARVGTQAYYRTLLNRLDYLTVDDLERMRSPGGNQMKSVAIVDEASLDVLPVSGGKSE